jgi:hypothetical protein
MTSECDFFCVGVLPGFTLFLHVRMYRCFLHFVRYVINLEFARPFTIQFTIIDESITGSNIHNYNSTFIFIFCKYKSQKSDNTYWLSAQIKITHMSHLNILLFSFYEIKTSSLLLLVYLLCIEPSHLLAETSLYYRVIWRLSVRRLSRTYRINNVVRGGNWGQPNLLITRLWKTNWIILLTSSSYLCLIIK